jgi:predicted dehydrogenase
MDNSTPMPFKFMREIVKKSKHIFCAEYPELSIDECTELNKLINESRSVVQVSNPYFFSPAIQWMKDNMKTPAFIDYSNFEEDALDKKTLFPMLLMLLGSTGISPKKIGAITFPGYNDSKITNVRLEFNDASVVNLNFGSLESLKNFKVRIYSDNQFARFNFTKNRYFCDNQPLDLDKYSETAELDTFIDSINQKTKKLSTLEDYLIAMHVAQKINRKIAQFSA